MRAFLPYRFIFNFAVINPHSIRTEVLRKFLMHFAIVNESLTHPLLRCFFFNIQAQGFIEFRTCSGSTNSVFLLLYETNPQHKTDRYFRFLQQRPYRIQQTEITVGPLERIETSGLTKTNSYLGMIPRGWVGLWAHPNDTKHPRHCLFASSAHGIKKIGNIRVTLGTGYAWLCSATTYHSNQPRK